MGIFNNVELGVESLYPTKKGFHPANPAKSTNAIIHDAINNINMKTHKSILKEETAIYDKENIDSYSRGLSGNRYVTEMMVLNSIGNLAPKGKNILFKDILFEFFYKSIPLDESYISTKKKELKYVMDEYIDNNGGYKLLENTINKTDSVLLKKMKSSIDKIVLEACKRKVEECKEDQEVYSIDFTLNDEEKDELDYSKQELGMDEITDLVRNKVLNVVKDEKEKQENEHELAKDIEDELKNDENIKDENSLNEAFSRITSNKVKIEDSTLFNAIMRNSYKEYLSESVAQADANHISNEEDDSYRDSYDICCDEDDISDDEEDESENDNLDEDTEIEMNNIMAESITQYTLMETLYTLKFEDYSYNNIRSLVNVMLNK